MLIFNYYGYVRALKSTSYQELCSRHLGNIVSNRLPLAYQLCYQYVMKCLLQAQSFKDSQDKEDIERVVTERIYLDYVAIPAFSEDEISKHKRPFLKGLHSSEVISKTSGILFVKYL